MRVKNDWDECWVSQTNPQRKGSHFVKHQTCSKKKKGRQGVRGEGGVESHSSFLEPIDRS